MQQSAFNDFDAFQAVNPQVDSRWLITKGRQYRWTAESLVAGDCQMLRCYSSTGLIIEGAETLDCYQFYVPFANGDWRDHGSSFGLDHVLLIEPGGEQCETCSQEGGWHGFFIPQSLVKLEPGYTRDRAGSSYTISNQRRRADIVRMIFDRYIAAVAEHPAVENSAAARMVEAELRMLLEPLLSSPENPLVGVDYRATEPGRPRFSRRNIMRSAQAYLEEHSQEPVHVMELAASVGVSERTLRDIFRDFYRIGVSKYLQLRQLHQVRRDLLFSDPDDTSVTDVLVKWGVWELGRFSGRYKQQFGELPSQSLNRPRQH